MQDRKDLDWIKEADYSTILTGRDEGGQPYLHKVFRLYRKVFGEACQSCPNKIRGYIRTLKSLNPDRMESLFKLRGLGMILDKLTRTYISNHNLTDDAALRLLKENPNRISRFSKFPEDWEEQVEAYEMPNRKTASKETGKTEESSKVDYSDRTLPTEDMKLDEMREEWPEIKARSKKEFIKEVDQLING